MSEEKPRGEIQMLLRMDEFVNSLAHISGSTLPHEPIGEFHFEG